MSEDQELAEAVVIGLGGYMPGDVVKCNAFGDGDIICRIEARLPSGSYKSVPCFRTSSTSAKARFALTDLEQAEAVVQGLCGRQCDRHEAVPDIDGSTFLAPCPGTRHLTGKTFDDYNPFPGDRSVADKYDRAWTCDRCGATKFDSAFPNWTYRLMLAMARSHEKLC